MKSNITKVLDHGVVELRNISGPTRRRDRPFDADDIDPANTARMSFDQTDAGRAREDDLRLANYLMKNWHTTPFEMIEIWCEMKLPIFVARQFVRHRTVTINEISGRYIQLPNEYYVPAVVGGKAKNKKQGQADNLPLDKQAAFKEDLKYACNACYQMYEHHLGEGVAPEHARMFLHLNHYTHWIWKQDLHNLMHFMSLRDHSHAQIEAQKYAQAVADLVRQYLPETMKLYDEYRRFK